MNSGRVLPACSVPTGLIGTNRDFSKHIRKSIGTHLIQSRHKCVKSETRASSAAGLRVPRPGSTTSAASTHVAAYAPAKGSSGRAPRHSSATSAAAGSSSRAPWPGSANSAASIHAPRPCPGGGILQPRDALRGAANSAVRGESGCAVQRPRWRVQGGGVADLVGCMVEREVWQHGCVGAGRLSRQKVRPSSGRRRLYWAMLGDFSFFESVFF